MTYTTFEFHQNQRELFEKSAAGEEVVILRWGKRFKLVPDGVSIQPYRQKAKALEDIPAFRKRFEIGMNKGLCHDDAIKFAEDTDPAKELF